VLQYFDGEQGEVEFRVSTFRYPYRYRSLAIVIERRCQDHEGQSWHRQTVVGGGGGGGGET